MAEKFDERVRLIASWVCKEEYELKGDLAKRETYLNYFKALLEVAGADGKITDKEREWVVGYATAIGAPQEVLNQIQTYQATSSEEAAKLFQSQKRTATSEFTQFLLIFDGYRAASADGELHPKEAEAINNLARSLGISDEKIRQILALYEEEEMFRQKRLDFLFASDVQQIINQFHQAP